MQKSFRVSRLTVVANPKITLHDTPKKSTGGRSSPVKGARFEGDVRRHLEGLNYVVLRSPKSGGVADLWAVKDARLGQVLFIQCKRDGTCSPKGWNALIELCARHGTVPVLACRLRRGGPITYRRLTRAKIAGRSVRETALCEEFSP